MKPIWFLLMTAAFDCQIALGAPGSGSSDPSSRPPNIIYILADDLGYGDVGCFWQNQRTGIWKFATPGLDAMAAEGAMMTHHYAAAPICVSSRASFMQGRHQGHAGIRDTQFDKALPNDHNVASMLKAAGYQTIHIGKAGLAGTFPTPLASSAGLEGHPLKRGFDRFFGYLRHLDGHEHYPRNGNGTYLAAIHDDYTPVTDAFPDVFTSDVFTAFAKKTIIEETTINPERPFFLYLAYDTPHFVGQYSPTANYPAGKGLSGGIQWTGAPSYVNTATNDPAKVDNPSNYHPSVNLAWYPAARKFVSMIRRMDDSVSDILQTLRDLGIDDNTLVVFTSDNGPAPTEVYPGSFESYAGFEGGKGDLWEAGIRVPTIVWWPGKIAGSNQLSNIRKIPLPSGQWDWMASFADVAKIPTPAVSDGVSLIPTLTGQGVQRDKGYLYFEFLYGGSTGRDPAFPNHGGDPRWQMQALRIGDFMGVRTNVQWTTNAAEPFRIYNVVTDPKQGIDVAAARPDLVQKINRLAVGARRKGGGVIRPWDEVQIPAIAPTPVRPGLTWKSYEGNWPWLPEFRDLVPVTSGTSSTISPAHCSRDNEVGLSFEGYISLTTSGLYDFQTVSGSSTCLWIHDSLVIDNDANFLPIKNSGAVYLKAGLHPIRLYFHHRAGTAVLDLRYSGPGIVMQSIPASSLMQDGQPTLLNPDSFTISRTANALIDVLANDTAEVALQLVGAGVPRFGVSSITSNRISYQPNPGFIGFERFMYRVNDGLLDRDCQIDGTVLFRDEIWFPLDEGSGIITRQAGGTATGSVVTSNDPSTRWKTGRTGRCLRFDGVGDHISLEGLTFPTGSNPRTFSCWMRSSSANPVENQAIFSQGSGGLGKRFTIRLAPTNSNPSHHALRIEIDGGVYSGAKRLNDGLWHHVVVSLSDPDNDGLVAIDETRIYVDGVWDQGNTEAYGYFVTSDTGAPPALGGSLHDPDYNFSGDIDDVRFFSTGLSLSEIEFLFTNPPKSPDYTDPAVGLPGDNDEDGHSDSDELIAGTDPSDVNSYPKIESIVSVQGGYQLSWTGITGRSYRILESQDLVNWSPSPGVPPVLVALPSPLTSAMIPAEDKPSRFFKLAIEDKSTDLSQGAMLPNGNDYDGDGASDLDEFISGTDPLLSTSVLRVGKEIISDGSIRLSWDAKRGRTYRLLHCKDLTGWTSIPGAEGIVSNVDQSGFSLVIPANDWPSRFVRVGVSITR